MIELYLMFGAIFIWLSFLTLTTIVLTYNSKMNDDCD